MAAVFRNPHNGHEEQVSSLDALWVLLFGGLYFAFKGVWTHFVAGFILALFTCGVSWLAYPFFTGSIMRTHYRRMGWREVSRSGGGSYGRSERDEPARPGRGPADDFDFS